MKRTTAIWLVIILGLMVTKVMMDKQNKIDPAVFETHSKVTVGFHSEEMD